MHTTFHFLTEKTAGLSVRCFPCVYVCTYVCNVCVGVFARHLFVCVPVPCNVCICSYGTSAPENYAGMYICDTEMI
jgi:hypothetical protein